MVSYPEKQKKKEVFFPRALKIDCTLNKVYSSVYHLKRKLLSPWLLLLIHIKG